MINITPEEKRAIATLRRLEKRWPDSIWLLAHDGKLVVMRTNEENKDEEAFDPDDAVTHINIPACGGQL